ncbi:MAG: ribbon-helix-helix protein, CopG family [Wenzhouxiangella sp.]|nr:ribbon-helix-helix protein, CopG family [Wenzhouxiangella sp.]
MQYNHIVDMVIHMKTTLNIDDSVMQRLREEAARRGQTMSELVEAGLRRVLEEPEPDRDQVRERLPEWHSGGALVDVADRDALDERMNKRS